MSDHIPPSGIDVEIQNLNTTSVPLTDYDKRTLEYRLKADRLRGWMAIVASVLSVFIPCYTGYWVLSEHAQVDLPRVLLVVSSLGVCLALLRFADLMSMRVSDREKLIAAKASRSERAPGDLVDALRTVASAIKEVFGDINK